MIVSGLVGNLWDLLNPWAAAYDALSRFARLGRAGERFRTARRALLSQYPMLALMVMYTMTSHSQFKGTLKLPGSHALRLTLPRSVRSHSRECRDVYPTNGLGLVACAWSAGWRDH